MDEFEICRLSAEALGYKSKTESICNALVVYVMHKAMPKADWRDWNPLTNAKQRWECVEWLLKRGGVIIFSGDPKDDAQEYYKFDAMEGRNIDLVTMRCPVSEFPARAIAELAEG